MPSSCDGDADIVQAFKFLNSGSVIQNLSKVFTFCYSPIRYAWASLVKLIPLVSMVVSHKACCDSITTQQAGG